MIKILNSVSENFNNFGIPINKTYNTGKNGKVKVPK